MLKPRTLQVAKLIDYLLHPDQAEFWYRGPATPETLVDPWGYTMVTGSGPHYLRNKRIKAKFNKSAAIISSDRYGPVPEEYHFEDLLLEDDANAAWALRMYDVGGKSTFRRLVFFEVGAIGTDKEEGHGGYNNHTHGDILYEWCRATRCDGQGFQSVGRFTEAAPGLYPATGSITFNFCATEDCGQGQSRGSWPFSLVTTGQSYFVNACAVRTLGLQAWTDPIWGTCRSRGGILIGPGGNEGEDATVRTPVARLRDFHVHVASSDRHLAKFDRIDTLDVENCTFFDQDRRGTILIGRDVKSVRWVNNDGNYDIWHDKDGDWGQDPGERIQGPVDYVWP